MNSLAALASDGPAAETVTPGVLGFISIAAVGVALYFLMKSMRRRLASIQVERDPQSAPAESGAGPADSAETPDTPSGPAPESPGRSSTSAS